MSIRHKLWFTVFMALFINVVVLVGYFNIFVSNKVEYDFNIMQAKLDSKAIELAHIVSDEGNFQSTLSRISKDDNNILLHLEDLNGVVIYESKHHQVASIYINSVSIVKVGSKVYLLRVTRPVPINNVSLIPFTKYLFIGEFVIIFVILIFVSIIIYIRFVKPIEVLQKEMEDYKKGHKPHSVSVNSRNEIGKLQNAFFKVTTELDEEKNIQNRIIASISHDIKTPLTSVMGYAERIKTGKLSSERTEKYMNIIYDKSTAIWNLVKEFDDYLSCNMKGSIKKQIIRTDELMQIIIADYADELHQQGVTFTANTDCPDSVLELDISKIWRVFGNIIGNSLKHFKNEENDISITCVKQDLDVVICIADNGIGVEEDKLLQILEPFYTSDEGRSVAGLGLAICKEIIQAHGGTIWAQNNPHGGLSVYLKLKSKVFI